MAGMHTICTYRNFSTNNPEKFEKWLTKWCKTISVDMHGKTMLIFDENELAFRDKATVEKMEDKEVHIVAMNEISFAYIRINGRMCIMYKVWENITQSVIYNMPLQCNGVELWVGA